MNIIKLTSTQRRLTKIIEARPGLIFMREAYGPSGKKLSTPRIRLYDRNDGIWESTISTKAVDSMIEMRRVPVSILAQSVNCGFRGDQEVTCLRADANGATIDLVQEQIKEASTA